MVEINFLNSLNSAVIENNNDNSSMVEMNFLISLISFNSDVVESDYDQKSMLELNFLISLISLNSDVIENNSGRDKGRGRIRT